MLEYEGIAIRRKLFTLCEFRILTQLFN